MDWNSAALAGLGCATPTICTNVFAGEMWPEYELESSAFPVIGLQPEGSLCSLPWRTNARTSYLRLTKSRISGTPIYPVPPAINTGCGALMGVDYATYRQVSDNSDKKRARTPVSPGSVHYTRLLRTISPCN